MKFKCLGKGGPQVSAFSLGTMSFGWRVERSEAEKILSISRELGLNLIDTSNSYGKGQSELLVGELLSPMARNTFLLSTKVGTPMISGDPLSGGLHPTSIVRECERSLRRLRTDTIDLYQLHAPDPSVPLEETMGALQGLVRSGKIRFVGTSNFSALEIAQARSIADSMDVPFISEQAPYHLLDRSIERDILPTVENAHVGLLTWGPLAEGILTGKYTNPAELPANSRFALARNPDEFRKKLTSEVLRGVESLRQISDQSGMSLQKLSLAWLMHQPAVTSILLGPSSVRGLLENVESLEVELSAEVLSAIDRVAPPFSVTLNTNRNAVSGEKPYRQ